MSATLSTASRWPAAVLHGAGRFGRDWAGQGGATGVEWVLRRNCSLSPRQLGTFYVSICLVSLLIASGFALSGAPVVLAFAGVELAVLGVALLVHARHVADGDRITLAGDELRVEQADGPAVTTVHFRAQWVRVEPAAGEGSLVELTGQGQRVRVGRFLRPELRGAFARELRAALRGAAASPSPLSASIA